MSIDLLKAIRARSQKRTQFRYGILTADRYVSTVRDLVGLDKCYRLLSKGNTSFDDLLKRASGTLVYANEDMEGTELLGAPSIKGLNLPKNCLMVFKHCLTSSRKDRDGDTLHSDGATVDPKMLLLWQHVHTMPIGKLIAVKDQNPKKLTVISCIVDMNELCHDAAVMVDNDMARFSHGFRAMRFTQAKEGTNGKDESGFDVKEFEIMEESMVSVPANPDAETEEVLLSLVEGGKLKSPIMKHVGQGIRARRPLSLAVKVFVDGKEVSSENVTASGIEAGGNGGGDTSASEKADAVVDEGDEGKETPEVAEVECPECGAKVKPNADGTCPKCDGAIAEGEEEPEEEKAAAEEKPAPAPDEVECTECGKIKPKDGKCPKCGKPIKAADALECKHPGHDDQTVHNPHGGGGRAKPQAQSSNSSTVSDQDATTAFSQLRKISVHRGAINALFSTEDARIAEREGAPTKEQISLHDQAAKAHEQSAAQQTELGNPDRAEAHSVLARYHRERAASLNKSYTPITKVGRALSRNNMDRIARAKEHVDDVAGAEGISRGHGAQLREASSHLDAVVKSCSPEEPKSFDARDAMAQFIAHASIDERLRMKEALAALEEGDRVSRLTKDYQELK